VLCIGFFKAMGIANVSINGARILSVHEPLVQTLQSKLASAMARRTAFIRVGVG
jgi:hypothetical protein